MMKIIVDKEAKDIITAMSDIVLKSEGNAALSAVTTIIASMKDYKADTETPHKKDKE